MCARSKKIIPGLLRRIQELEIRLGEKNDFHGIDTTQTTLADEEVSSAAAGVRINPGNRRRNWFIVLVLAIAIFCVLGKQCLENM